MSDDIVLFDVADGIATITLNRPDKHNAYVPEMGNGILDGLDIVENRDDVRCVVFEGNGKSFSAGGDIEAMRDRLDADPPAIDNAERLMGGANEVVRRVFRCPLPTVAKVDGVAVGAGASIALACDVLLASERAAMGFVFRRVGLAVDTGISYLLPRLVGTNVAKELVYTGELVDASRGDAIGLFNHVYSADEFEAECESTVETIAKGPTQALRQSKRLIEAGQQQPFESALEDEAMAQAALQDAPDHEEGITSFLEGRDPEFSG